MYQEHREILPPEEAAERLAACLLDSARNAANLMAACPEVEHELREAAKAMAYASRQIVVVLERLAGDPSGGEVH